MFLLCVGVRRVAPVVDPGNALSHKARSTGRDTAPATTRLSSLVLHLLCGCDRRLEWCCSDVDLAAVVVTEPKHPVHGMGARALRRGTNRVNNSAVLNRTTNDIPLELDAIRG